MRRTMLVLALCAPLALGAQASKPDTLITEFGFYYQRFVTKDALLQRYSIEGYRYQRPKDGFYYFVWYEPAIEKHGQSEYLSGTGGWYYDFTPTFEVALIVGGEVEPREGGNYVAGRYGGFVNIGTWDYFLNLYGEYGPSGPWHQGTLSFKLLGPLTVGVLGQTDDGVGPRLRLRLPKTSLFLSATWMARVEGNLKHLKLDWKEERILFGLDFVHQWKAPHYHP